MIRRSAKKDEVIQGIVGEFHLRGQNSRLEPLRLRWKASESLYYGGDLQVVGGPVGLRSRFEGRLNDRSWLKNNPDRIAGGRPFTESFFATVAVLMAFADAERLMIECVQSPVPMTSTSVQRPAQTGSNYSDIEEFDRGERRRTTESRDESYKRKIAGSLRAG